MAHTLWTIGHSNRPIEEFIELLRAHGILLVVDVRTMPRSRSNPQFNADALAQALRHTDLQYHHVPGLGGLRKPKKNSINLGWRNESFRGYADYMQTDNFRTALDELVEAGRQSHTAIMCAEAVPWRCHRSLIADVLTIQGWTVRHITNRHEARVHSLTSFAMARGETLTYPLPSKDQSNLF
ncbi:MAG TPA: DUF488 domain-containing protein [Nitrospiraceae bacterium]|jgi:uncharacterized protein (DUF488 family)